MKCVCGFKSDIFNTDVFNPMLSINLHEIGNEWVVFYVFSEPTETGDTNIQLLKCPKCGTVKMEV